MGVSVLKAITFGVYGNVSKLLKKDKDEQLTLFKVFAAGVIAGIANSIVITPMDRVKILLQTQRKSIPFFTYGRFLGKFLLQLRHFFRKDWKTFCTQNDFCILTFNI